MAIEKTYSMLKPDAVRNHHIGEIVSRIERAGLVIERMELANVTPEQAAANYAEHEGKPFYNGLIEYITSGPVVKMVSPAKALSRRCAPSWAPPTRQKLPPARFVVTLVSLWTKMLFTAPTRPSLPSVKSASSSVHK